MREFSTSIPIYVVDVGSLDSTVTKIQEFIEFSMFEIHLIPIDRLSTPLDAFRALITHIDSDFICAISGDDYFLEGYGSIASLIINQGEKDIVVNFGHTIVDHSGFSIGKRLPGWISIPTKDRLKLLFSNPGTTAGCLLPWKLLKENCLIDESFNTLIEDYYFSCKLVNVVTFQSVKLELVAYRKHAANLSSRKADPNYAVSLGVCVRQAWNIANSPIEKLVSLTLLCRWGRHVSISNQYYLLKGLREGTLEYK
jgi:hypothetical protein